MHYTLAEIAVEGFLSGVRLAVARELRELMVGSRLPPLVGKLVAGKMLRTRLAHRLWAGAGAGGVVRPAPEALERACAALELVHTASLCHDDVIDNARVRRHQPTLWLATSSAGAVLIGDLLFCASLRLILEVEGGRHTGALVSSIREVCAAEAEQELHLRGQHLDLRACLRIARGKTGPLFAFAARVSADGDAELRAALEEAGYLVGTAYQLADDLLDVVGREPKAGKTLGLDAAQRKFTLALASDGGPAAAKREVARLCCEALGRLGPWSWAREALEGYLVDDLGPVLKEQMGMADLQVGRSG